MSTATPEETPRSLFHYTSIDSLALILKNKSFRFTKLSNLNDPTEGKNFDFKLAEHFVFSSSWTAAERDTIPMWKMYTDLKGVRLKLPSTPFDIIGEPRHSEWGGACCNYATLSEPACFRTTSPSEQYLQTKTISGPDKVKYQDRKNEGEARQQWTTGDPPF